jgi:hypothetical protein
MNCLVTVHPAGWQKDSANHGLFVWVFFLHLSSHNDNRLNNLQQFFGTRSHDIKDIMKFTDGLG